LVEELIPLLFAAAIALTIAWYVARPPAVFAVQVHERKAIPKFGKTTDAFLGAVADVCAEFGVCACEVRGIARGTRIALWFSSGIPEAAQQRLRNWWAMSGWSAKPTRRV
jgi:hypothetical protein